MNTDIISIFDLNYNHFVNNRYPPQYNKKGKAFGKIKFLPFIDRHKSSMKFNPHYTRMIYKIIYDFNDYYPSNLPPTYVSTEIKKHKFKYQPKLSFNNLIKIDENNFIEGMSDKYNFFLILLILCLLLFLIAIIKIKM